MGCGIEAMQRRAITAHILYSSHCQRSALHRSTCHCKGLAEFGSQSGRAVRLPPLELSARASRRLLVSGVWRKAGPAGAWL